jgi:hypothetical protein
MHQKKRVSTSPRSTPAPGTPPGYLAFRQIWAWPRTARYGECMTDPTSEFVYRWLYTIEGVLKRHLENLKDDLLSDDERTRNRADRMAGRILDRLYPPLSQPTDAQKVETASKILADDTITPAIRLKAVSRVIRSGGRGRGRPRTDASQHAIHALTLRYSTQATWPQIAYQVKGCKHKGAQEHASCSACADAIRSAANSLESFLFTIGYKPDRPRGTLTLRESETLRENMHR